VLVAVIAVVVNTLTYSLSALFSFCASSSRVQGMSQGGMFTSWLSSRLASMFAGFAPVSGTNPRGFFEYDTDLQNVAGLSAMPYRLWIHGRNDTTGEFYLPCVRVVETHVGVSCGQQHLIAPVRARAHTHTHTHAHTRTHAHAHTHIHTHTHTHTPQHCSSLCRRDHQYALQNTTPVVVQTSPPISPSFFSSIAYYDPCKFRATVRRALPRVHSFTTNPWRARHCASQHGTSATQPKQCATLLWRALRMGLPLQITTSSALNTVVVHRDCGWRTAYGTGFTCGRLCTHHRTTTPTTTTTQQEALLEPCPTRSERVWTFTFFHSLELS
jgi:hypothetical protein